jgi:Na+-transporting methylmalonyl-CoA/oxaloacetate decarboxylase gamma subunit
LEKLAVGIELTFWGMGLVFLLLALLSGLIALLRRLERRVPLPAAASGPAADLAPELLAAVFLAVREHRRVRRKQAAPAMRSHQPGSLPSRWVGAGRTRQNRSWAPGGRYS